MSITPENLPADVLEAIGRGETIEAIKLLRGHTGLGLAEAKYLLDQYRAGQIAPAVPESADADMPTDVREALARGNMIEAIKLLRRHTGLGLKEATDLVDQYWLGKIAPAVPKSTHAGMLNDLRAALARGNKIEAIKLLRGHTGLGLKEAKDWIEAHDPSAPEHSTAPPPTAQASSSWWWLIAVILAAIAAFALLRGPGAEAPL
ncbi:MAG: ribosomal protein L7/L12 [Lysobacterales bacterium]